MWQFLLLWTVSVIPLSGRSIWHGLFLFSIFLHFPIDFLFADFEDVPQIILIQKRFRTNLLSLSGLCLRNRLYSDGERIPSLSKTVQMLHEPISAALISTIRRMADAFSLLTISLTCPACYADTRRGQGHPGILRNWPWYAVRT